MAELARRRPQVKLVFMGVNHPDYVFGPKSGATLAALEASRRLGLTGKNVFFLDGWVPYEEIDGYLADADASVCLGSIASKAGSPSALATSTSSAPGSRFSARAETCSPHASKQIPSA